MYFSKASLVSTSDVTILCLSLLLALFAFATAADLTRPVKC